ncbi:MAG: N,N-dimethylformamidase beta subunit family domain-containing protein [Candidatus Eiseniibacteriota bacterium]
MIGFSASDALPAFAVNEIVPENLLPGNPQSEWDISGAGDGSIQGFATDISVNRGGTIEFKIDTPATSYQIDIYRMGWYGGLGARKVATILPSAALPQSQPAPLYDAVTGLTDCGNWAVSASWTVPANAVSGVYIARPKRTDVGGDAASHIIFVVRDDASTSDLLMSISESTYQAYNSYGGNSLYGGSVAGYPAGHATKVSYNRPFITRSGPSEDWFFNADYPMVRWLERNGYDVSYFTNLDTGRNGGLLLNHKAFISVGHDEYWSAEMRTSVENARAAGKHLAWFSGNEVYWKVRWEPSTDGSLTPNRTMVCYKEGTLGELACGGKCDPSPTWTGLWRDGCAFSPPSDGCLPENALTSQISWDGSTSSIQVPETYSDLRFWRNTSVANLLPAQTATLTGGTLGYEWDFEQFPASYPPGRIKMSDTFFNSKRHHLSLYRHASGALVFGAGTVQWSWGLDGTHDRGGSVEDPAVQQATVNLFAEMGAQPATIQAGLVQQTASGDLTAPVSAIGFPLDGGNVPAGTTISISGTANEAGGVVGGVEVSVNNGATWALATGGANWSYSWTPLTPGPVTIRARAVDDWGNLEAPGSSIAVTVDPAPPAVCPCTLWPTTVAVGGDAGDGNSVEVGVKFRSDVDGFITGIRYYKHAAAAGTHVGKLWTTGGALLESATFTGESASGWQEVAFGAPVAITAGTTYIASVFLPNGHYAFSGSYFATSGHDNAPLHALAEGVDGPNGVFLYAPLGGFPTTTFQSSNYWVDVRFETETGPDETPPSVTGISPGNNAVGVAVGANVVATFNEVLDALTVDGTTVELRDPLNALVPTALTWSSAAKTITIDPVSLLDYSTQYTARLKGGVADPRLKDLAGNALGADFNWSFTTAAPPPPPPDEGPGGPILVVTTAGDPYGRYFAEILRNEGLNAFTARDISLVTGAMLADYKAVVLASMPLSAPQVTMLTDWVDAGGRLVAIRPDAQLASLCGLTVAGGTLSDAYLKFDTTQPPGQGLTPETIQFHGAADLYTNSGATLVATLYSNPTTVTANPAVVRRSFGVNGGHVATFTYDLARSVVWTRQGNPAWAGQERDGTGPGRSDDMFFGAASFDPQPDWINLDKVAIPQADEQQRLLANLIQDGMIDVLPLPRYWYFPSMHKAVIIMTGDNHASSGMQPRFDQYLAQSPPGCSVDDWECVRASGYLYIGGPFNDAQALAYHNQGFEVGIHFDTGCANFTPASLQATYSGSLTNFAATYPSVPPPSSNRNHCVVWSDWVTTAETEAANGIRLDVNYYYWPPAWGVGSRPGMFTGSGMPMRFARLDGSMVDCYQAATQMTDESSQAYPSTCDALLDKALGPEEYYGAFTANMHFDHAPGNGSDQIVGSALSRGVPVVSGRQMLTWLDGRNGSSFQSLAWDGTALSFAIAVGAGARNLQAMLPRNAGGAQLLSLTRNAAPVVFALMTLKGREYAVFPADAGNWVATFAPDLVAPVISNVVATPAALGTSATITWDTDEASDSRVDYGTSPGTLDQNVSSAANVTGHSLLLSGLSTGTTYYYRVTSADESDNSTTEPNPPAAPLSFATPTPPCLLDDLTADFAAGTVDAGAAVRTLDDGEVTLAGAISEEFNGTTLPADWGSFPWGGGSSAVVSGGVVTVDGTNVHPNGGGFGPGSVLEFRATFGNGSFQHGGFGAGNNAPPNEIYNTTPFVIFTTSTTSTNLFARTLSGGDLATDLGPTLLNSSHLYRIEWNAGSVQYFVDNALVATHAVSVPGPMRPAISDIASGGAVLVVDRLQVTPYAPAGTFLSRIADGGGSVEWGTMSWTAQTPAGTSLALSVRAGETATPDGSWTSFVPVPASGTNLALNSRYLQYRAELATSNTLVTPVLEEVAISCGAAGPDVTPPVITNVVATPDPGGTSATVTWDTNEPANSRVDYGTSPGLLDQSASLGALVVGHSVPLTGLAQGTTYYYRVTSADAATNPATEPNPPAAPLSFSTPAPPCLVDDLTADFADGTPDANIALTTAADGEVTLKAALFEDFPGTALPAGWGSFPWAGGGGATVGGGSITVDASCVNPLGAGFGPGTVLEFRATFAVAPNQHIGFGSGADGAIYNTTPFLIFSTAAGGTTLNARTYPAGIETPLGAGLLGSPHVYKIDWQASSVVYSVDGVVVATHGATVPDPMRPAISDIALGGGVAIVDWVRLTPYAPSGTFLSRVAGSSLPATWETMSWTTQTPPGTSVAMAVRTGDTPTPDGTWTAFAPVATSGSTLALSARYLQYRAELSTSDPSATPALEDVTVTCNVCADVTPPVALSGFGAAAATTGNGPGGSIKIHVTSGAPEAGATVELYRAARGDYPLFAGGAPPSPDPYPPSGPWTLITSGSSALAYVDTPGARDLYTYAAYVIDACGNVSPSTLSSEVHNYHLGDVSDGVTPGTGDNAVNSVDLSLLGAHYGETGAPVAAVPYLDFGPTTDGSTSSPPQPDGRINFEELVLMALSFDLVSAPSEIAEGSGRGGDELSLVARGTLDAGSELEVSLVLQGSGRLQGLSTVMAWDKTVLEPLGFEAGGSLTAQGGVAFSPAPGAVDAVLLGKRTQGLTGEVELARLRFRVLRVGDPKLSIQNVAGRDGSNRPVTPGAISTASVVAPRVSSLLPVAPNPARNEAQIRFGLARAGAVSVVLYTVDGRRVRELLGETREAGVHTVVWDGRDGAGQRVGAGIYYVRFTAPGVSQSRSFLMLR